MADRSSLSPTVPGEVSIDALMGAIIRYWWLPVLLCGLGSVGAYLFARTQTPIYRAEVLVSAVQQTGAEGVLGSLASQLGGLGQIAGISGSRSGDVQETIALLRSRLVASQFIAARNLATVLFPERWDSPGQQWKQRDGASMEPTKIQSVVRFSNTVRQVEEDRVSGHITVAFELPQRELVAELANAYVEFVNTVARERAVADADLNLGFLRAELQKTDFFELRGAISRLIEAQVGRKMLAITRPDYALRILDPAVTPDPDQTVRPRKLLLAAIGGLGAGMLGVVLGLILGFRGRSSDLVASATR